MRSYVLKTVGMEENEYYTVYENDVLYSIPVDLFIRFGENTSTLNNPISSWYESLSKEERRTIRLEIVSEN